MFNLVILGCLFGAVVGQYWSHGGIHDTPDVETAKAKHFAAHAKARATLAQVHGSGDDSSWNSVIHHDTTPYHSAHYEEEPIKKWTGPIAFSPGYDKHGAPLPVEDTHEVAAEKARHFQLYSHGAYAGAYSSHVDHSGYPSQSHSGWVPTAGPWGY